MTMQAALSSVNFGLKSKPSAEKKPFRPRQIANGEVDEHLPAGVLGFVALHHS